MVAPVELCERVRGVCCGRPCAGTLFVAGAVTQDLCSSLLKGKNVMFHTGEQKTRNNLKQAVNGKKRRGIFMKSIREIVAKTTLVVQEPK